MILAELHPRIIETNEWIVVVFLVSFFLIAVLKNNFEKQFFDFIKLFISSKYLKIYRDESQLKTIFTVILFLVNLLSTAFFIQLIAEYLKITTKTDGVFFIKTTTFLLVFILVKFLIEKIIGTLSDTEELINIINLQKITYRGYIGLLLLPILLILFFNKSLPNSLIWYLIVLFLIANLLVYVILLRKHQNELFRKMFYFILYLCTLEIAPYYFLYYLVSKK